MREYIKSFRIFSADILLLSLIRGFLGGLVGLLMAFLIEATLSSGWNEDFKGGFIAGFLPAAGIIIPTVSVVLLNNIFASVNPAAHGYKYFHSLHDGPQHLKRAIILGNVVSLIACAAWAIVVLPIGFLFSTPILSAVVLSMGLFMLGGTNFLSYVQNMALRLLGIVPVCLIMGFTLGFSSAMTEDGETLSPVISIILVAASVIVFIGGLIFALKNTEKHWYASEKTKAKKAKEAV